MSESKAEEKKGPNNKNERYVTTIPDTVTKYQGEVLNDKKDGYGTEHNTRDDTVYEGYWRENKYDGEGIFYIKPTNCFFKGIFKENCKQVGIEIFPNGDIYEGQYLGDQQKEKFHGRGCLTNKTMGYRYEGTFQLGQRHGFGKEFYKSGAYYEGEFRLNQKHGKGKLVFSDGSYYEGDFIRGVPYGFGVYVAPSKERSRSIMPILYQQRQEDEMQQENLINLPVSKENNEEDQNIISIKSAPQGEEKDPDEYYYEGEFVEGYKHGIGRYFEPDGSYYYCRWEFDRKVGQILYYNAAVHRWKLFDYKEPELLSLGDVYQSPDNERIISRVNILKQNDKNGGFPPDDIDAYKAKIDECGISGERFEDPHFQPTEDSFGFKGGKGEEEIKDLPPMEFIRISENDLLAKSKHELFINPIKPGKLILNEQSDYQLVTCMEALAGQSQLLFKVFSVKYDLEVVSFFTMKLYIEGFWQEQVIDDYIPCFKINKLPIFSNTEDNEIGWMVLQKS